MRKLLLALWLCAVSCGASAIGELKPWSGGATPPLALADLAGQVHTLEQYRGKVVLVNFWATWCEPCRAEMPSMQKLRRSLEGRPFEVLAVNLAEPRSRIEKFVDEMQLGLPVVLDRDSSASRAWKARILPSSFLVGRDGRIRYVGYGEIDWTSAPVRAKVSELLSEGLRAARD